MSHLFKKLILTTSYLLIFTSLVFAEEPSVFPQEGQMVFRGLDTKSSPTQIQDGRASDLLNVEFTTTFGLKKRNGYSLIYSLDDIDDDYTSITGLYYTRLSDSTDHIIAVEGDKVFDNGTSVNVSAPGGITAAQNNQFVWVTALDTIVFSNDINPPFKYTGSGNVNKLDLTDLTTDAPTIVKSLAWFQNFLILGNTTENGVAKPTRIRWSNIGFIETWTETDRNDISELGGQEIEGFGLLYDDLYIFLTDSIWKMSFVGGSDVFRFIRVIDGVGCIAKNSIQTVLLKNSQRGLIFLDKDAKVYFFNGITLQYISEIIEPTMNLLNISRLPYAVSIDTKEEYRLFVSNSNSTTNNKVFTFNYTIGEWSIRDQEDANVAARVRNSNNEEFSYIGNYKSMVLRLDDTSLNSDVSGGVGTISSIGVFYDTDTASALQVIYDSSASYTASGLIGGTILINSGDASGEERVIADNTTTGIVITSDFTTTPSTNDAYSVGAINTFYQSKNYDFGSVRLKNYGEMFLWVEEQGNVDFDFEFNRDFGGTTSTDSISENAGGALWDTAIWDVDTWGGAEALLARIKLLGDGRFLRFKMTENDIDETFLFYSWKMIYWLRRLF